MGAINRFQISRNEGECFKYKTKNISQLVLKVTILLQLYKPNEDKYESFDSNWGKSIAENRVMEGTFC